jgi:hypothetical protein
MKKIRLAIVLVLVFVVVHAQENGLLSFNQLFPVDQQNVMGLNKLNQTEKEELRKHVVALLLSASQNIQKQLTNRPNSTFPNMDPQAFSGGVYVGVGSGHWIKEKIDSGDYILLEDGSLWEIASLDRLNTRLWLKTSSITVVEASGYPGYGYILINTDDGESARVRFVPSR